MSLRSTSDTVFSAKSEKTQSLHKWFDRQQWLANKKMLAEAANKILGPGNHPSDPG
jgi:hypothetical protein